MESITEKSQLKGSTCLDNPDLLHQIFEKVTSTEYKNNLALIFEDEQEIRKYNYSEVNSQTNRLARLIRQTLRENNSKPNKDGDHVIAVALHPSDYLVITLLAIWKAGAAYLPLDPTFPKERVEHILQEAQPSLVIYDKDNGNFTNIFKLPIDAMLLNENKFSPNPLSDDERLPSSKDNIAIILYTSGSTGVPKGVRLPHRTILNRLQWQFKTFPYGVTEKTAIFKTALTFVDSVSELWGPLLCGLAVLVIPKSTTQNPKKLVQVLEHYKINRLVLVPSLLRSLLTYFQMHETKLFLPNLTTWVCSGETLVASLVADFYKYFPSHQYRLCNFYGSTEIMGDVTYHIVSESDEVKYNGKIPIGTTVDNTLVYLLDSNLQPVEAGTVGELFVSGLNLAAGYVNGRDPEKFIHNSFTTDPIYSKLYRTGDFARFEDGILLYEGRTDSQVKIRGHRVDLSEIEKAVNSLNYVKKSTVLCYKPGEQNQALLAFVTTDTTLKGYQIEDVLRKVLVSYMVPHVIQLDELPLLVNGKVDRQSLLKMYENTGTHTNGIISFEPEVDYTGISKSQMAVGKVLLDVVASVLNRSARKTISIDSNFYDIGGNSLNSIYTIGILNEKGYHISVEDFISAKDFEEILNMISIDRNKILYDEEQRQTKYFVELLRNEYKSTILEMVSNAFYQKSDLEKWMVHKPALHEYKVVVEMIWDSLLEANLSCILKTEDDKIVGVALNLDANNEPDCQLNTNIGLVLKFLNTLEESVRLRQLLPSEVGTVFHSFILATDSALLPKENVLVVRQLEAELTKIARSRNFKGILSTNTNRLTQQLASSVFSYDTLLDYQVNKYVDDDDNTKLFGNAPDDVRALVQWKALN